jgi:hypothetical protein
VTISIASLELSIHSSTVFQDSGKPSSRRVKRQPAENLHLLNSYTVQAYYMWVILLFTITIRDCYSIQGGKRMECEQEKMLYRIFILKAHDIFKGTVWQHVIYFEFEKDTWLLFYSRWQTNGLRTGKNALQDFCSQSSWHIQRYRVATCNLLWVWNRFVRSLSDFPTPPPFPL